MINKHIAQSKEAEMIVIGCILNNIKNLNIACEKMDIFDFYFEEHQTIFSVIKKFYHTEKPADVHLVCSELKRLGKLSSVGGASYIMTLVQYAGTSAHIEEYVDQVRKKSRLRKIIKISEEFTHQCLEDPDQIDTLINNYQNSLINLEKKYSKCEFKSIKEILFGNRTDINTISLVDKIKERNKFYIKNKKFFDISMPTGIKYLDEKASILEDTNFIVIAGRPATGKTAFALNIATNICMNLKHSVGFISLEMSADQIAERVLSLRTGIPGEKIKRGTVSYQEILKLEEEEKTLSSASFLIDDTNISSVYQVVSKARQLKDQNNIKILFIDYLQLLSSGNYTDNRQYEVAEVSRTLKKLAIELKIPIVCIAQLSRKVEERINKRPMMSDLRDSGQIEQDADVIMFIYRKNNLGEVEIIVSKNRHGSTVNFNMDFQSESGHFCHSSSLRTPKPHNY